MLYQEDSLKILTVAETQDPKNPGTQAFCQGSLGGRSSCRLNHGVSVGVFRFILSERTTQPGEYEGMGKIW